MTSLNGLGAAVQTFVNDTNVTVVSAGTTHTLTWAGQLANTRGGTGQNSSAWSALSLVTAGTWSQYAGTTPCGAGDFIVSLNASGVATCGTPAATGTVTHTTGGLTLNQLVIGNTNDDIKRLGTLGTTTTVLHGNAAGAPTFAAVDLANDVTGVLGAIRGGTGQNSSAWTALPKVTGGVWSQYTGTSCGAGDFIAALSASGGATCGTPAGGGNVNAGGTLVANQLMLGAGGTSTATLGTLGTSSTVLHGNAVGAPTFGAVNLATDVTGDLSVSHLNGGSGANANTCWHGDGTWGLCANPPAGSDTFVQFNDAGSFGGVSSFVFNKTTGRIGLGTAAASTLAPIDIHTNPTTSAVAAAHGLKIDVSATPTNPNPSSGDFVALYSRIESSVARTKVWAANVLTDVPVTALATGMEVNLNNIAADAGDWGDLTSENIGVHVATGGTKHPTTAYSVFSALASGRWRYGMVFEGVGGVAGSALLKVSSTGTATTPDYGFDLSAATFGVAIMKLPAPGSSRALCVDAAGLVNVAAGNTCP